MVAAAVASLALLLKSSSSACVLGGVQLFRQNLFAYPTSKPPPPSAAVQGGQLTTGTIPIPQSSGRQGICTVYPGTSAPNATPGNGLVGCGSQALAVSGSTLINEKINNAKIEMNLIFLLFNITQDSTEPLGP